MLIVWECYYYLLQWFRFFASYYDQNKILHWTSSIEEGKSFNTDQLILYKEKLGAYYKWPG